MKKKEEENLHDIINHINAKYSHNLLNNNSVSFGDFWTSENCYCNICGCNFEISCINNNHTNHEFINKMWGYHINIYMKIKFIIGYNNTYLKPMLNCNEMIIKNIIE